MSRPIKYEQMIRVDRLKELCADVDEGFKGYGYASFRRKIGIGHASLCKVLYEGRDFSTENLIKIANTTGVSLDWLFGLSDRKYIDE